MISNLASTGYTRMRIINVEGIVSPTLVKFILIVKLKIIRLAFKVDLPYLIYGHLLLD